ncbi:MAG: energy coupling factor transporter S component ThiW [Candidatus Competibacteraceae bacterium]|nr:energy coupling factor transporter S component ThiW [Candidatus Competibacteraceae bacterium]MCB1920621.1 energy coupling factor transporter S component ThiW [Candidatus Competibacteraceae bacterium]MCP5124162.1 energy coupling factor transporter S component ThiW [Gammaproteobacteria bacterium]HRX71398.1 energy coupling factor transporter S component ThiW [Candidatus Competibacteraceae bacterium]
MSIHDSPNTSAQGAIPPTRLIAYSVALAALAVALSPISIPIGIAKISPTQHFINVIAGALVGPWWGLAIALVTSLIRNAIGLGTPLAFPGSVFGVVLAGLAYRYTRNVYFTALGEIIGTGLIGASIGALLVAPYLMGKDLALTLLILPFLLSSAAGAALGITGLGILRRLGYLR